MRKLRRLIARIVLPAIGDMQADIDRLSGRLEETIDLLHQSVLAGNDLSQVVSGHQVVLQRHDLVLRKIAERLEPTTSAADV